MRRLRILSHCYRESDGNWKVLTTKRGKGQANTTAEQEGARLQSLVEIIYLFAVVVGSGSVGVERGMHGSIRKIL
jgi:hypothetical protein